jgi:iron-sulfur cluster assembly accessory protein
MSDFPVSISPEAVEQLQRIVARQGKPGSFIRVGVKGGGCSGFEYVLRLDEVRRDGDLEIVIDGVSVVCDPKSASYLKGSTLVYTGNLIGGGFSFENPNAKRSCGCGTSFTPVDRD